jgi:hypothetical protein
VGLIAEGSINWAISVEGSGAPTPSYQWERLLPIVNNTAVDIPSSRFYDGDDNVRRPVHKTRLCCCTLLTHALQHVNVDPELAGAHMMAVINRRFRRSMYERQEGPTLVRSPFT